MDRFLDCRSIGESSRELPITRYFDGVLFDHTFFDTCTDFRRLAGTTAGRQCAFIRRVWGAQRPQASRGASRMTCVTCGDDRACSIAPFCEFCCTEGCELLVVVGKKELVCDVERRQEFFVSDKGVVEAVPAMP